jgi:hypothetical protein
MDHKEFQISCALPKIHTKLYVALIRRKDRIKLGSFISQVFLDKMLLISLRSNLLEY